MCICDERGLCATLFVVTEDAGPEEKNGSKTGYCENPDWRVQASNCICLIK